MEAIDWLVIALPALGVPAFVWRAPRTPLYVSLIVLGLGVLLITGLVLGRWVFLSLGWSSSMVDRPEVLGASLGIVLAGILMAFRSKG